MERAFERLNAVSEKAPASLPGVTETQPAKCLPATISTTTADGQSEPTDQLL